MTTPETSMDAPDLGVGKEVTITRVFDARRELVYDVWTDERHIASWSPAPSPTRSWRWMSGPAAG